MSNVMSAAETAIIDLLTTAAVAGLRCPTNPTVAQMLYDRRLTVGPRGRISELAYAGLIKVEVYSRNWRVVELLTGPHKGKRTQEPPFVGEPYLIIAGTKSQPTK